MGHYILKDSHLYIQVGDSYKQLCICRATTLNAAIKQYLARVEMTPIVEAYTRF